MKIRSSVTYGNNKTNLDEWQQTANPWTVVLKNGRKTLTVPFFTGRGFTGEPKTSDVLWCIVSDANYVCDGFEWFCGCLGYDTDSRKAEAIFKDCLAYDKKLKKFLGDNYSHVMGMDEGELNAICKD